MNQRKAKKIRQYYRRTIRSNAESIGKKLGNSMKPKPKFIPWWLWMWLFGFFVKLK